LHLARTDDQEQNDGDDDQMSRREEALEHDPESRARHAVPAAHQIAVSSAQLSDLTCQRWSRGRCLAVSAEWLYPILEGVEAADWLYPIVERAEAADLDIRRLLDQALGPPREPAGRERRNVLVSRRVDWVRFGHLLQIDLGEPHTSP
jgi:hypothetical protein